MKPKDTRVDRIISGIKNNPVTAFLIAAGIVVISISAFTDAAKNIYGLVAKEGPDDVRIQLSRMSLQYTPHDFVQRAKMGDIQAVRLFLAAGMNPDATEDDQERDTHRTAMMYAASGDHAEIVDALLKAGADPTKEDQGETALSWAAGWGSMNVMRILLDPRVGHRFGSNALDVALDRAGEAGRGEAVRLLLPSVADPKRAATEALLATVQSTISSVTDDRIVDVATQLLDRGADVNERDNEGWTPLLLATENKHAPVIPLLLDKGADINAKCVCAGYADGGWTALLLALNGHDDDVAETLIDRGADVNQTNKAGLTALRLVAGQGGTKAPHVVELLLDKGADIDAKSPQAQRTALMDATMHGNIDIVRLLLARGAATGVKNADGQTAMALARKLDPEDGRSAIVALLEKAGPEKPEQDKARQGRTGASR